MQSDPSLSFHSIAGTGSDTTSTAQDVQDVQNVQDVQDRTRCRMSMSHVDVARCRCRKMSMSQDVACRCRKNVPESRFHRPSVKDHRRQQRDLRGIRRRIVRPFVHQPPRTFLPGIAFGGFPQTIFQRRTHARQNLLQIHFRFSLQRHRGFKQHFFHPLRTTEQPNNRTNKGESWSLHVHTIAQ